jgi:hypothetical protein
MDTDICLRCNQNINENDKKMEMPCCGGIYHTECGIQAFSLRWGVLRCECEHFLKSEVNGSNGANQQEIVITEEARDKIIECKQLIRDYVKNKKVYTPFLKEKILNYKENIDSLVNQIKTYKNELITTIRNSEEYKNMSSNISNIKRRIGQFKSKYGFDNYTIRNEVFMSNLTRYRDIVYYYNIATLKRRIRLKL